MTIDELWLSLRSAHFKNNIEKIPYFGIRQSTFVVCHAKVSSFDLFGRPRPDAALNPACGGEAEAEGEDSNLEP